MLDHLRAQELEVACVLPSLLKHPSFVEKRPLWLKEDKHPTINAIAIKTQRYQYIKIGRTFGFETTRYLCLFGSCLFYFDDEGDTCFKGFCDVQNLYVQWLTLKNGRYLLFLSNGFESSFFFFEKEAFWKDQRTALGKWAVRVDFPQEYEILEQIGKGSFSKVQRVRNRQSGLIFAAKVVAKRDKNNAPTRGLVLQERRILRMIRSQYVYSFEELFEQEDSFVFIMEYLPGKDLMALWKEKKLSDPALVLPLLKQILEGVRDIHRAGVIHRDLKPQNILVNLSTLRPCIIDFGLSLVLDETVSAKSYKRCGTMGYMAPQVIENTGESKKPYNNKCDIFSFGIIAHMLLLGFNPVKGDTYDDTFMKNKACEIAIDKNAVNSRFGEHCWMFLTKLLAKYPQFRLDAEGALKSEFLAKGPEKEESQV